MAEDDDEKPDTVKKSCTIARLSLRRLERLAKRHIYGTTPSAVMTSFIEAGLRQADKDAYIRFEDDDE
jgi:hypothetical protein